LQSKFVWSQRREPTGRSVSAFAGASPHRIIHRIRPASMVVSTKVLRVKRHQTSRSAPRSASLLTTARRSPGRHRRSAAISSGSRPVANDLAPASSSMFASLRIRYRLTIRQPFDWPWFIVGLKCIILRRPPSKSNPGCTACRHRVKPVVNYDRGGARRRTAVGRLLLVSQQDRIQAQTASRSLNQEHDLNNDEEE